MHAEDRNMQNTSLRNTLEQLLYIPPRNSFYIFSFWKRFHVLPNILGNRSDQNLDLWYDLLFLIRLLPGLYIVEIVTTKVKYLDE